MRFRVWESCIIISNLKVNKTRVLIAIKKYSKRRGDDSFKPGYGGEESRLYLREWVCAVVLNQGIWGNSFQLWRRKEHVQLF